LRDKLEHHGAPAHLAPAGSPRPRRPENRRRYSRRRAAAQARARRAAFRQGGASRPCRARRPRPRADAAAHGDGAAPARHAAASARLLSREGLPAEAPRVETILLIGAVQILWLDVPDHAAVDLSVRLAQADRHAARYAGLVNAVLRRVTQNRTTLVGAAADASRDTPQWLFARWTKAYGRDTARAIARANGHEPALDLTVKDNAEVWAERLHGRVLPTGSVRTLAQGAISLLPGFAE